MACLREYSASAHYFRDQTSVLLSFLSLLNNTLGLAVNNNRWPTTLLLSSIRLWLLPELNRSCKMSSSYRITDHVLTHVNRQLPNLRRPVAVNAYYSYSQQEWAALVHIAQTFSHPRAKWALKKLIKHDKAGQIHEVSDVDVLLAGGATNLLVGVRLNAQRTLFGVAPIVTVPPAAADPIVVAGPIIPQQPTTAPAFNQQVSAPAPNPPGSVPALDQPGTATTSNTPSMLAAFGQSANPSGVHQFIAAPSVNQAPPPTSLISAAPTPIFHQNVAAPVVISQRTAPIAIQTLSSTPPAPSASNRIPAT
ncbi:hypothetical protein D6D01_02919 [Aureobasidium pullulans]|uniref:Uncharacterized protein n=1 Tax=Aureobasidium pullulans TaxID=5580 RepID=A0A4S9LQ78_AURPU|nr:hypothetical protein D6D01_02919 [Aureobasidium pullulans]